MQLPIIKEIKIKTVLVPVEPPHRTASGIVDKSPLVLIDLHCECGLVGHAMVFTYTPAALKPCGELILGIQAIIQGQELAPRGIYHLLQDKMRLIGTQGLIGMALAGIDMALWDAYSRFQSAPLYRLLGGSQQTIYAYAGTGFDGAVASANQAEAWVKKGYRGVKAKIGYPTVNEDIAVVRAMRDAVGPDVELMVDYNQSLSVPEAIHRIQRLDHEDLLWVEEPVLAQDYSGSASVSFAVKTPIQSGENWWGPIDMSHAIVAKASNYVMPDAMKIGGVSGWLKAVALAEAAGIPVSSHLWPELSAHLLMLGATSHRLEYVDWWAPILKQPLLVENGVAILDSDIPGTGVEWNTERVNEYIV